MASWASAITSPAPRGLTSRSTLANSPPTTRRRSYQRRRATGPHPDGSRHRACRRSARQRRRGGRSCRSSRTPPPPVRNHRARVVGGRRTPAPSAGSYEGSSSVVRTRVKKIEDLLVGHAVTGDGVHRFDHRVAGRDPRVGVAQRGQSLAVLPRGGRCRTPRASSPDRP